MIDLRVCDLQSISVNVELGESGKEWFLSRKSAKEILKICQASLIGNDKQTTDEHILVAETPDIKNMGAKGGYFGTHCHICHESVRVCKCYRASAGVMSAELIKELELLKSYFEDSREVVLHINDINWKVIDACLAEFKKLNPNLMKPNWPEPIKHEHWCPALGGISKCACHAGDINLMREDCIRAYEQSVGVPLRALDLDDLQEIESKN